MQTYPVDARLVEQALRQSTGPASVAELIEVLLRVSPAVYVGGGAPRDWLSGAVPRDLDLYMTVSIAQVHAALVQAYPEKDYTVLRLDHFGLLRWGSPAVDISFLRNPDALCGKPVIDTVFQPGADLRVDTLMRDFSVNALYYDCVRKIIVEPIPGSVDDLRARRLRLISDPRKLAVDARTCLRIAQFMARGYEADAATAEYLAAHADSDVTTVGADLAGWIGEHIPQAGRARFADCLLPHLSTSSGSALKAALQ